MQLTLAEAFQDILGSIISFCDSEDRNLSEIFMELPSKKAYPQYYRVIRSVSIVAFIA